MRIRDGYRMVASLAILVATIGLRAYAGEIPTTSIEVPTALPFGTPTNCSGVRPGALIESDKGLCTMNFLFQGSNGARYVGTAGHCILGESPLGGEEVGEFSGAGLAAEVAPLSVEARDGAGNRIGDFAYAILSSAAGPTRDFSLVRLDPSVTANAQICHFGGPTGTNAATPESPVLLHHYGNGLLVGEVLPARTHLALHLSNPDEALALGLALPGDSGAGVISDDGGAVGVLVTVGVNFGIGGPAIVDTGIIGITRIAPQVDLAETKLGIS
ncbi:MAG: hypothetical protein ACREQQ_18035, partial [Candidatus Binatia bacterium]